MNNGNGIKIHLGEWIDDLIYAVEKNSTYHILLKSKHDENEMLHQDIAESITRNRTIKEKLLTCKKSYVHGKNTTIRDLTITLVDNEIETILWILLENHLFIDNERAKEALI